MQEYDHKAPFKGLKRLLAEGSREERTAFFTLLATDKISVTETLSLIAASQSYVSHLAGKNLKSLSKLLAIVKKNVTVYQERVEQTVQLAKKQINLSEKKIIDAFLALPASEQAKSDVFATYNNQLKATDSSHGGFIRFYLKTLHQKALNICLIPYLFVATHVQMIMDFGPVKTSEQLKKIRQMGDRANSHSSSFINEFDALLSLINPANQIEFKLLCETFLSEEHEKSAVNKQRHFLTKLNQQVQESHWQRKGVTLFFCQTSKVPTGVRQLQTLLREFNFFEENEHQNNVFTPLEIKRLFAKAREVISHRTATLCLTRKNETVHFYRQMTSDATMVESLEITHKPLPPCVMKL